jgi:hypothetical protein
MNNKNDNISLPFMECNMTNFLHQLCHTDLRSLLCWTGQHEAQLKIDKMDQPGFTNSQFATTMSTKNLINVYVHPTITTNHLKSDTNSNAVDRDVYWSMCRARREFTNVHLQNDIFFNQTQFIHIESDDDVPTQLHKKLRLLTPEKKEFSTSPIPPTMCHFVWINIAMNGFNLGVANDEVKKRFHFNSIAFENTKKTVIQYVHDTMFRSSNHGLPTTAIMGGSITCCLEAWQDPIIQSFFANSGLFKGLYNDVLCVPTNNKDFQSRKWKLILQMHHHFHHHTHPYKASDVDIFAMPSPTERMFHHHMVTSNIPNDIIQTIYEYVGSYRLGTAGSMFSFITQSITNNVILPWVGTTPIYTATESIISSTLTSAADYIPSDTFFWPRVWQLILLSIDTDLESALFDFDFSCVGCAFNGVNVWMLPRCMLSFISHSNFITPFCFDSQRTQKRISKYAARGWKTFIFDPHDISIIPHIFGIDTQNRPTINDLHQSTQITKCFVCHLYKWKNDPRSTQYFAPITTQYLCTGISEHDRSTAYAYPLSSISKQHDEVFDFFQAKFGYDTNKRSLVESVPINSRMVCLPCRNQFLLERWLHNDLRLFERYNITNTDDVYEDAILFNCEDPNEYSSNWYHVSEFIYS